MANDLARAEFWQSFVSSRCNYPSPNRLRAQLAKAEFSDFCECGCNSFAVNASQGAAPLVTPDGGVRRRAIFTADFKLADERTLEIILFANGAGNLDYIEVDCCANSYPVPDLIEAEARPFRIWATDKLLS